MSPAVKVAIPAVAIAIILFRISRSPKPREWFGLAWPRPGALIGWTLLYLAWMLASDAAIDWRGPWDFAPWRAAPLLHSALRLLAVTLLGPITEELIFRGTLFAWIRERAGIVAAIAATAIGWALLHVGYSWQVILVIAVDGLLLGLARWRTGSLLPPVVMHALYNLYAIW